MKRVFAFVIIFITINSVGFSSTYIVEPKTLFDLFKKKEPLETISHSNNTSNNQIELADNLNLSNKSYINQTEFADNLNLSNKNYINQTELAGNLNLSNKSYINQTELADNLNLSNKSFIVIENTSVINNDTSIDNSLKATDDLLLAALLAAESDLNGTIINTTDIAKNKIINNDLQNRTNISVVDNNESKIDFLPSYSQPKLNDLKELDTYTVINSNSENNISLDDTEQPQDNFYRIENISSLNVSEPAESTFFSSEEIISNKGNRMLIFGLAYSSILDVEDKLTKVSYASDYQGVSGKVTYHKSYDYNFLNSFLNSFLINFGTSLDYYKGITGLSKSGVSLNSSITKQDMIVFKPSIGLSKELNSRLLLFEAKLGPMLALSSSSIYSNTTEKNYDVDYSYVGAFVGLDGSIRVTKNIMFNVGFHRASGTSVGNDDFDFSLLGIDEDNDYKNLEYSSFTAGFNLVFDY